jgi:TonB family protein
MSHRINVALILSLLGVTLGCEFHARSPEDYRKATREVLETRNAQIQGCYDEALKTDKGAEGRVIVRFTVEAKTGTIKDASVQPESTAPEALGQCIVQALDGLALQPPDQRVGDATFAWEFQQG